MGKKFIESRVDHVYIGERVTPVGEIPPEFRLSVRLPGGRFQITDKRLCYNWKPGKNGGRYVECGSVACHAEAEGIFSPEL